MNPERLNILYVSQMPACPPRFGAQARVHGLMTQLAQRHELTAVILVDHEFDLEACRRAMQAYCREVVLVPNPNGRDGLSKRLLQLRSLVSTRSFERLCFTVPALQRRPQYGQIEAVAVEHNKLRAQGRNLIAERGD
jgi:hypothetical protein